MRLRNLDLDIVLRSWISNGTILDTASLDPDQTSTFINIREGVVDTQRTLHEKAKFANINGLDVSMSELFNPQEKIYPVAEIAKAESFCLARSVLPVPVNNQLKECSCMTACCQGPNYECISLVR